MLNGNGVNISIKANISEISGKRTIKIEGNWTAGEISAVIEKISEVLKIDDKKVGGSR